jgi:hypothetical protein
MSAIQTVLLVLVLVLVLMLCAPVAGIVFDFGAKLDTAALVAAVVFSVLLGVTLGAAMVSHLRNAELSRSRRHLGAEIDRRLTGGRRIAGAASSHPLAPSSQGDRVSEMLAALEHGDVAPDRFDAALDQELEDVDTEEGGASSPAGRPRGRRDARD